MPGKSASKLKTGATEVPTAQTAVALCPAQANAAVGVWVQSDPNNVGASVAIGDVNVNAKATLGSARGFSLPKAGAPVFIEISNPESLFVDVVTSKDFVLWTILFA